MRKWLIVILSVAWLIWELLAAFVPSLHAWPLTQIIVTYVPAPITALAVAALVAWLPRHFADNYKKRKGTTVPVTDLTQPQPQAEPLLSVGTITAAVTALIGLAVSFGLNLSEDRQAAVLGVVAVLAPVAVAVLGRRQVFSPATVAKLLASRAAVPAVPPVAPPAPQNVTPSA